MDLSKLHSPLDVFDYHACDTPDAPFLVEDLRSVLSYREVYTLTKDLLASRLCKLCPTLLSHESSTQPRVLLVTPNNSLLILTILALWRLSCVAVPVQPRIEPGLWTGMISCSKPALVISAPAMLAQVERCIAQYNARENLNVAVISLVSLIPAEFRRVHDGSLRLSNHIPCCRMWIRSFSPNRAAQASIAFRDRHTSTPVVGDAVILFTSSAVDQDTVKGVTYTHRFLISSCIRTIATLGADPTNFHQQANRHLGWLPLSHCFEFGISFCGIVLTSGGSYIFFDNAVSSPHLPASTPFPSQLLRSLAYFGDVSSFSGVPFVSQGIADASSADDMARLRHLRYFNVAGAPTSSTLFQWMAINEIAYADSCGATEVLWIACRRTWSQDESLSGLSVCPGLMGVIHKARAEDMFGELIIMGKDLPTRYDNVDTGAFTFDTHNNVTIYRTGDLYQHTENVEQVSIVLDGQALPTFRDGYPTLKGISYLGRIDDTVVLSTGEKVDALAIEQGLEQHADIERSAVVADVRGVALVAVIQPRLSSDTPIDWEVLTDVVLRVNLTLPFEKRIRREHVFFVEDLPTTPKNTLHRKRLRKLIASLGSNEEIPHFFPPPKGAPSTSAQRSIDTHSDNSPTLATHDLSSVSSILVTPTYQPSDGNPPSPFSESATGLHLRDAVVGILIHIFDIPRDYFEQRSTALADLALTSLASVELSSALSRTFSVKMRPAEMYALHTIDDVCTAILRHQHEALSSASSPQPRVEQIDDQQPTATESPLSKDICITGAACRFPGGIDSLSAYWSALLAPDTFLDFLTRLDDADSRPTARSTYGSFPTLGDAASGFTTVKSFANFFGIPPPDAAAMSLNSRLVMQMGYEAIEDAGIAPSSLSGKRWGIFTALNESGWRVRHSTECTPDVFASDLLNLADDAAAGRLAYYLNINGPAIDIKTACSSSAVAIHQALLAIRNDDCDAAVVIAATTHVDPAGAAFRMKAGIASPTGRCLPFSQWADGFVPGEGAAAIVLQKFPDARVEPYAIMRASAIVQDGASRGFLSPNPTAQATLLKTALDRTGHGRDDMQFVEAHGTGTQLGDSIELLALTDIYQKMDHPLLIGSCKAVIGHTEECAGLAGVLKGLLCFKHGTIPPQPFNGPLNEILESAQAPFVLPNRATPLRSSPRPRLIGISSFGLSGTLAHIVLEELPPHGPTAVQAAVVNNRPQVFLISAVSESDLRALAERYVQYLGRQHLQLDRLTSICMASRLSRVHHPVRRALVVHDWRELLDELQGVALAYVPHISSTNVTVGVWFGSPIGSNYHAPVDASGYALYATERNGFAWLAQYDFFAAQLALARTLVQLGVKIDVVGGEGAGEIVAAVVAGVMEPSAVFREPEMIPEDVAFAVAHCREDLLVEHLVTCTADEAMLLGRHSATLFSLRGTRAGLDALAKVTDLNIDIVVGDALIRPCHVDDRVPFDAPSIPIISAYAGGVCDDVVAISHSYWRRVQTAPSNGEQALRALRERCRVVVNLGSHLDAHQYGCPIITGYHLEEMLGQLYEAGCDIHWEKLEPETWRMERLPGYRWARSDA